MRLLLKIALVLPLACAPVLALAAHSGHGGGYSSHGGFGGPARVIRSPGRSHFGNYATFGLGIGLGYALSAPYSYGYSYYGYPYSSWYYGPQREVIVERNTYIEEPAANSELDPRECNF